MSVNESDIFEENDLYILGNKFKDSVSVIYSNFLKHSHDLQKSISIEDLQTLQDDLK